MAKPTGRRKSQLPDLYYEGYLEKRSFKDKTSRKLWTCLCENKLFFFNEKRDNDYTEKLDLTGLISVTDDSSPDAHLDAARFNVQTTKGNIKFTAPNAESRELWKGFMYSVAKLQVPLSLNLLPGQVHILRETIQKERERLENPNPPPEPSPPTDVNTGKTEMPACYYEVPRLEAELLLEREAHKGNLLLRPGRDGRSFAMTTRQDLDGPIFRHYRLVANSNGGFYIDVDKPVHFDTLHKVVAYMVEKTERTLTPLNIEDQYDKNISFILSDHENGERHLQPLLESDPAPEDPTPGTGNATPAEPEKVAEQNAPATDKEETEDDETDLCSPGPTPPIPEPRTLVVPPSPAPRKNVPGSANSAAKPTTPAK
ncbi:signal-transducing adaptor protein 1-like, partial [Fundulus diaphanus]